MPGISVVVWANGLTLAGITKKHETTVAWSRQAGKLLARAVVWAGSRTKHTVARLVDESERNGLELEPRHVVTGKEAADPLQAL